MELIFFCFLLLFFAGAIVAGIVSAFLYIKSFTRWDIIGLSVAAVLCLCILACWYYAIEARELAKRLMMKIFFRPRHYQRIKKIKWNEWEGPLPAPPARKA